jgi:group II intron reverse transcriptase/maturase
MTDDLCRISEISSKHRRVQNIAHLIDEESLKRIHVTMDGKKARGVDGINKSEYQKNLDENISRLVERMKRQAYVPNASRRVYIDKPGSRKKRPLGISCYGDKLAEARAAEILNAIYEPKFYDFSYGFRPEKNCHQAIRQLINQASHGTRYIVEADIRSFFDRMDHEWLLKFLSHDIADRRFIELIRRMLKADVLDEGKLLNHEVGSPQGSGVSPVLANVYLHYVLDDWFAKVVVKWSKGSASVIRYADDFVCCFDYREDAERFYKTLPKRFAKFGLELAEEKTRILQFGIYAAKDRTAKGEKKPETFNFLGFTFYCGINQRGTMSIIKVKSDRKKTASKLKKMKLWLKENRTLPVKELIMRINRSLVGHFNYYGVTGNGNSISTFRYRVVGLLFTWLNRRSQRKSYTWESFYHGLLQTFPVAMPKIYVNLFE